MKGRPRSFDLDDVLTKAMHVFWRHGYEGASLARLQEATGLTPPSVYNAFGSKEGLYEACLDHYAGGPGARPVSALSGVPRRAGIRAFLVAAAHEFTRPGQPPGCMISTAALALSPDLDPVAGTAAARRAATLGLVADYLARAQAGGALSPDADPTTLARFFGAVIQGMSVQAHDGATVAELTALADVALAAWA